MFVLFFSLMLIFTVSIHLGRESESESVINAKITLDIVSYEGEAKIGDEVKSEGRFTLNIMEISETEISLLASGRVKDGAFLIGSAKYLSLGQPFEVKNDFFSARGEIGAIQVIESA